MAWWSRIRNVFRSDRVNREIDEELQSHLDEAVHAGRDPGEVRRAFGPALRYRDESRDIRVAIWLEQTVQDLRYAVRLLARTPTFTAVAVLSLALGIGANTAMFGVINVLRLRYLPVEKPNELVAFRIDDGQVKANIWPYVNFSYPGFVKLRDRSTVFRQMAAVAHLDRFGVAIDGAADPAPTRVALVSGTYFPMLGVNAALGRALTADDDRIPDGEPYAVISDAFWAHRFGRRPDIIGRTFALNNTTYTVLGVTPSRFTGDWVGRPTDIWIPIAMESEVMVEMPNFLTRDNGWVRLLARLKPDVTLSQADAATRVVWNQMVRDDLGPNPTPQQVQAALSGRVSVESAAGGYSPQRATLGLSVSVLMVGVGLVLLVACANVANLLLVRAAARRQEITIRIAVGADRRRIVRQLLTEGVVLTGLSAALGLVLSNWGTSALSAVSLAPIQLDPRAASAWVTYDLRPDVTVFTFTAGISLLAAALFALAPALRGSRVSLQRGLTVRGLDGTRKGMDLGKGLVVAEVAVSLVLLIGAGQFVRTMHNLRSVDLGLDRQHVLLVATAPGQTGRTGAAIAPLWDAIRSRLTAVPGVTAVGASNGGLLIDRNVGGASSDDIRIPGQAPRPGQLAATTYVTPGYLATVGLSLVAGRDFGELDNASRPTVTVVNETFAQFFFGDRNPVGQHFGLGAGSTGYPLEIVGVVKNTKYSSPRNPDRLWFYRPYLQGIAQFRNMQIALRLLGRPEEAIGRVRQELQRVDPTLPILGTVTIDQQLDTVLGPERLTSAVATALCALATFMSCLGLYGVIAYGVTRRTSEIGLRMSLGATRARIFRLISIESTRLVVAGLVIGLALAVVATRLLRTWWFGIPANDPVTFVTAALVTVVVAGVAAALPAYRASRINPLIAMRHE
jgi:predicted permease